MKAELKVQDVENPMTLTIYGEKNDRHTIKLKNEDGEFAARNFKDLTEAYKVFEKLSSWMIFGAYSDNEKFKYLIHGRM